MKLKVQWYADIDQDERDARRHLVMSSKETLDVLRGILVRRLEEVNAARRSTKQYEEPNWPYVQADLVGAERELVSLLELVTLTED